MSKPIFKLSSEQLTLLTAFEETKGLAKLAESLMRDPSVISRALQRIAEDFPVLVKVKGRWELTPLGRQVNEQTRNFSLALDELLKSQANPKAQTHHFFDEKSVLLVINAQVGLLDLTQEGRNNSDAEKNIVHVLAHWRKNKRHVIHVKHISDNPGSIFYKGSTGSDFLPNLGPQSNEEIIEKTKSSAFSETNLSDLIKSLEPSAVCLVGFTANECIDATAKDAAALGLTSFVVGDATAMFDMRSPDGKLLKAERLHKLTLANINAFYAKVIQMSEVT